jgi:hypothetical protein
MLRNAVLRYAVLCLTGTVSGSFFSSIAFKRALATFRVSSISSLLCWQQYLTLGGMLSDAG